MLSLTAATSAAKKYWNATKPVSRSRCQSRRARTQSASESRTSATWRRRTFTSVLLESGSPTHSQPKNMDWCCAAISPTSARAALANIAVPPPRSDGSHDGRMSTFSKPFSAGSTSIRRRCANGAKRSSIPSYNQGPNGSNTLLDEDAAAGCLRDGTTRSGLQSHARNEHHGHPAAHGSDQSIVGPEKAQAPTRGGYQIYIPSYSRAFSHGQDP